MARYALRNQDKIADKLGKERVEMLLSSIKSTTPVMPSSEKVNGLDVLIFNDARCSGVTHRFSVTGGLYDVKILAYLGSQGL